MNAETREAKRTQVKSAQARNKEAVNVQAKNPQVGDVGAGNTGKSITLFSWNVNGIRAVHKKGEIQVFLEKYKPDFLCLQEIKANQSQFSELGLSELGYNAVVSPAKRPGYSGTAILWRSALGEFEEAKANESSKNSELDKSSDLTDEYGDLLSEGRITTLDTGEFYLCSVYTPNSKNDLSRLDIRVRWDKFFLKYIRSLEQIKPVIFCGDLNVAAEPIDLENPKQNEGKHGYTIQEREGIKSIRHAGFTDTFRKLYPDKTGAYSWWSHFAKARERNVGWRIDYFFVSDALLQCVKEAGIHPAQMGSDHCPISLTLALR
jgi:exodeoxyribonuclease-3